ncbi:FAD-binding oxidoreductase [Pararhodobacter sp. CCB-MM2]|uniref:NAD(P)/FAD-dependent oxidoreductase n=1 Tax=Pararhodobacter sp. CCB-MM2 TaxID=1786003 RepID=UPI000830D7C7|nr:FAD-dependent oxidoreductase [Pararhodobacter sp. CCB-MM2]
MIEFLVIGGGIAGLSAGAALAPLGRVMLVEGEDSLGYHCSGRSAALYEADYGAPATVAVARSSLPALQAMGVLSPRGVMIVAGPGEEEAFAKDCADLLLTPLSLEDAFRRVPILNPEAVTMAAMTETAQDIDTEAMLQHYARQIRAQGGEIRTRAPVTAIQRDGDHWRVEAGGEWLQARKLVNAAGAWADRIAVMAGLAPIGIQPLRRSMAQLPGPEGLDCSDWPMVFGAGESWYMKPQAGKLLVSPAEEDPTEPHDAWADDMVLAEGLARFEAMVTYEVTRLETSWAGLRSFSPDRALVLGPDPEQPDFLWCAGQGGQGFLAGPGAAAVLAETAGGPRSGQPASVLAALSPARFR